MTPDEDDEDAPASWPGHWAERDPAVPRAFDARRALSGALLACAVLVAGWQWHWRDKLALLESRLAEQAALRESGRRLAAEAASAEPLRRRLAELAQALAMRERHLPDRDAIDELLLAMDRLAAAHGARMARFQPQAAMAGEDFAQVPLKLRVEGGYREIAAWLAGIAALPRLVTLQSMQLTAAQAGGALAMEGVVLAYRRLDAAERGAPLRAQPAARPNRGDVAAAPAAWQPMPLDPPPHLSWLDAADAPATGEAGLAAADPFALARLTAPEVAPPDDPLAGRVRGPLEAFPLERIRMVGSLRAQGRAYGVVRVEGADGLVAALQVGERLGRHGGVVVRIGEDEIALRERVWNGEDRWIETTARLALDAPA